MVYTSCGEGSSAPCARLGLTAEPQTIPATWNPTTFAQVTASLSYTVSTGGCCASALWCNTDTRQCFTDSSTGSALLSYPECIDRGYEGRPVANCLPLF